MMLRTIGSEYLKGFFSSLQGFLILHKIDNPPVNANVCFNFIKRLNLNYTIKRVEQRRNLQKSVNSHQTVLENRRQREQDKRSSKSVQNENSNKISTLKRIIRVCFENVTKI
jgi:hypothetical protein